MNRLARERSPYLLQHANNPVDWFPWSDEAFSKAGEREQADLSVDWLLDVPLVPRHGARVVRAGRGGVGPQRSFRVDQGRSRRATGRRSRLHDVRAGDDRLRRLADERLADAGVEAVLWRHLLSAVVEMGPAGLRRDPAGDRPRLERGAREGHRVRRIDHAPSDERGTDRGGGRGAGRRGAGPHGVAVPSGLRLAQQRVRRRAEVSAPIRAAVPAARARAVGRRVRARHGAADAARDGARRHARPRRRRLSPLFGRRRVAGAAFREDALRPGAARARLCRGRAGVRRSLLSGRGGGHAPVRHAPDDRRRRRLLFGRRRRQRPARARRTSRRPTRPKARSISGPPTRSIACSAPDAGIVKRRFGIEPAGTRRRIRSRNSPARICSTRPSRSRTSRRRPAERPKTWRASSSRRGCACSTSRFGGRVLTSTTRSSRPGTG